MPTRFLPFLVVLLSVSACTASRRLSLKTASYPPNSSRDDLLAHEAADRHELVLPAPPNWKAQQLGEALSLTLYAENTTLHVADRLRYRFELKNIGEKAFAIRENPSFVKGATESSSGAFHLFLTAPNGGESRLLPPAPSFYQPTPTGGSNPDAELFLRLAPGETLVNRPSPTGSGYRDLKTAYQFENPGRYALKIIFTEGGLKVESNRLEFVVAE